MSSETVHVLAVEDNPVDVLRLRAELAQEKSKTFEVSSAETLAEAREALGKKEFRIILLDLGLPDGQGLETFSEMRNFALEIPIVVLSGLDDENVAIEAVARGAQDYICKDRWDSQVILRSINYALERHQAFMECKRANDAAQEALIALQAAQQRLELALNGADLVPWEQNLETREVVAGDSVTDVLGFTPGDLHESGAWKSLTHKDDVPLVKGAEASYLRGDSPTYEAQYRIRTKSGEWKWVLSKGKIVERDENGKPLRMAGTFLDISSHKHAEEALRASEERFRTIFRRATDHIFVMDREGRYVQVNPAFEALAGCPAEKIIGRTAQDVLGKEPGQFSAEINRRVLQGETVEGERTLLISGAPITLSYSLRPLKNSAGEIDGVFGISRDITDRKRVELSDQAAIESAYPSTAMQNTLRQAMIVAQRDSIVLLLGESGSGKDWLARYIHNHSSRAGGPYFGLNCAAISHELAESELFGNEKGAFTGAIGRKRGLLELAEGGTLLLNEVGDLPLPLQAKLLTFLDTHKFTRVGAEKEVSTNARLIAATNRDLDKAVEEGTFRRDLFYRFNVMRIDIPPLRERAEDIPVLAKEILSRLAAEMQFSSVPTLDTSTLEALKRYHWPGNVRELRNVLERTLILWDQKHFDVVLPGSTEQQSEWGMKLELNGRTLREVTEEITRSMIVDALQRCNGNKKEAAKRLGIARDSLYRYLKQFELVPADGE